MTAPAKVKSASQKNRNPDRRCGKAWKKRRRTNEQCRTGRTVGGYTPAGLKRRAAVRGKKAAEAAAEMA